MNTPNLVDVYRCYVGGQIKPDCRGNNVLAVFMPSQSAPVYGAFACSFGDLEYFHLTGPRLLAEIPLRTYVGISSGAVNALSRGFAELNLLSTFTRSEIRSLDQLVVNDNAMSVFAKVEATQEQDLRKRIIDQIRGQQ